MALDLGKIEGRLQQTTQGLWGSCLSSRFTDRWAIVCPSLHPHDISIADNLSDADSAFIAFAHGEDLLVLIAEVKRLRAAIEDALEKLESPGGAMDAAHWVLETALYDSGEA